MNHCIELYRSLPFRTFVNMPGGVSFFSLFFSSEQLKLLLVIMDLIPLDEQSLENKLDECAVRNWSETTE